MMKEILFLGLKGGFWDGSGTRILISFSGLNSKTSVGCLHRHHIQHTFVLVLVVVLTYWTNDDDERQRATSKYSEYSKYTGSSSQRTTR